MQSVKNVLQEYFQKLRLPLPEYFTRATGEGHALQWRSTVTLSTGQTFNSQVCTRKIDAETSAAQAAIDYLRSVPVSVPAPVPVPAPASVSVPVPVPVPVPSTPTLKADSRPPTSTRTSLLSTTQPRTSGKRIGILVDVENQHTIIEKFLAEVGELPEGVDICAFIGKTHSLIDKDWGPNVHKIVVPIVRKDGVDVSMIMHVGFCLSRETYDKYIIVTGDHFGAALVELISSPKSVWSPRAAVMATRVADIIESLVLGASVDNGSTR